MEIREVDENPYRKFGEEWEKADREQGIVWDKETSFFELVENGELAGYFVITINGGVAELKEILVSERFRKRGFGRAIVDYFTKFSTERKCHKLIIVTSERQKAGRALYERCGFEVENTSENDRYHLTWYTYSKRT